MLPLFYDADAGAYDYFDAVSLLSLRHIAMPVFGFRYYFAAMPCAILLLFDTPLHTLPLLLVYAYFITPYIFAAIFIRHAITSLRHAIAVYITRYYYVDATLIDVIYACHM